MKRSILNGRLVRIVSCLCAMAMLWMSPQGGHGESLIASVEIEDMEESVTVEDSEIVEEVPEEVLPAPDPSFPGEEMQTEAPPLPQPESTELPPLPTPAPDPIPPPGETAPTPEETGEITPPEQQETMPSKLTLGEYTMPSVRPGEAFDISLSIVLEWDGQRYESNLDSNWPQVQPYITDNGYEAYHQAIALHLDYARVSRGGTDGLPLDMDGATLRGSIVADGINYGYALLSGMSVAEGADAGRYEIPVTVVWREKATGAQEQILETTLAFEVLGTLALEDQPGISIIESVDRMEEDIQPMGIPHGDDGIIVYTYTELRNAIQGGQYGTIYLGYDEVNRGTISYTDAYGIAISRSLVIDGADPLTGRRMTLVDWNSEGVTAGLYASANNIIVTVQHMNFTGRNFYGIMNGRTMTNVELNFVDVQYTGRQMAHNYGSNSVVSLTNCTATITDVGSGGAQELAEATGIVFYGTNTIERTGPQTHSVIWLHGAGSHRVTIAEGAQVTISTSNYLIFDDTAARASLEVYGTLRVSTAGGYGSMTYADQVLSSVNVHSGGVLEIDHQNTARPTLYVTSLSVAGTLSMRRAGSGLPLIALTSGGSLRFDSPRLVTLENAGGALLRTVSGTAAMTWQMPVLNRYSGASILTAWNNANLSAFAVSLTATTGGATITGVSGLSDGGIGAAIHGITLQNGAIQLMSDTRLVLGTAKLALDQTDAGQTVVTGVADADAAIETMEYAYSQADGIGAFIQDTAVQAGGDGSFSTGSSPFAQPIRHQGTRVYARSDNGTLICYTYTTPIQRGPVFLDVPETLPFETAALSGKDQLIQRAQDDWNLQIYDGRTSGEGFALYARILFPLSTASGDTLPGSLVYVRNGAVFDLEHGDVLIARGDPSDGMDTYRIHWPAEEGLLVRLPAFQGVPGVEYETTIQWMLTEGP